MEWTKGGDAEDIDDVRRSQKCSNRGNQGHLAVVPRERVQQQTAKQNVDAIVEMIRTVEQIVDAFERVHQQTDEPLWCCCFGRICEQIVKRR